MVIADEEVVKVIARVIAVGVLGLLEEVVPVDLAGDIERSLLEAAVTDADDVRRKDACDEDALAGVGERDVVVDARRQRKGMVRRSAPTPLRRSAARWSTPKRCCSSMTTNESERKSMSPERMAVVPKTTATSPRETALAETARSSAGVEPVTRTQRMLARSMFVPVSPSGTGKTLSLLISSDLSATTLAAAGKQVRMSSEDAPSKRSSSCASLSNARMGRRPSSISRATRLTRSTRRCI